MSLSLIPVTSTCTFNNEEQRKTRLRRFVSLSFSASSKKAVWRLKNKSVPTHPAEGPLSKYECLKRLHKWTSARSQSRRALLERTEKQMCTQDGEANGNTAAFALFPDHSNIREGYFIEDRLFCFFSFVFIRTSFNTNNPALTGSPAPAIGFVPPVKEQKPSDVFVWLN